MGRVLFGGGKVGMTEPVVLPAIGTALNDLTWEEIRAISDAGVAANYFSIGDAKTIAISGTIGKNSFSLSVDAFILGINHNAEIEGDKRIHFQIGRISGVDVCFFDAKYGSNSSTSGYFAMNASATTSGGWESCQMRKTILGSDSDPTSPTANTFLAALPSDLRDVMKSVTKYTDNTGGGTTASSAVTSTTEYLFLLSEYELYGKRTHANSAEQNYQAQYDYFSAGNSKDKYRYNATTIQGYWWLRSIVAGDSKNFLIIIPGGTISAANANYGYGAAPAFCV